MNSFYKQLAPMYHLLYPDWDAAIETQGRMLTDIIGKEWNQATKKVLDVSCGIGTQSLALAALGLDVTASDLSPEAVERAKKEAETRDLTIKFSVCDMKKAHECHGTGYDLVLCAGNALPHLLSDAEILKGLESMFACLEPGGGCLISMRQYDQEKRGTGIFKPFGVRDVGNRRYVIFQIWDFIGERYKLSMYFLEENHETGESFTHVMRSEYYAISPDRVLDLMSQAGFDRVRRLDYYLEHGAILVGTRK